MTTEVEHNKKRKYFPILINGKIKYIRDRKDDRIKNKKLQKEALCCVRR